MDSFIAKHTSLKKALKTLEKGISFEIASPKPILQNCFDTKIISEKKYKILIQIIENRNLTSHAYNKKPAEKISQSIPGYCNLMSKIANHLKI